MIFMLTVVFISLITSAHRLELWLRYQLPIVFVCFIICVFAQSVFANVYLSCWALADRYLGVGGHGLGLAHQSGVERCSLRQCGSPSLCTQIQIQCTCLKQCWGPNQNCAHKYKYSKFVFVSICVKGSAGAPNQDCAHTVSAQEAGQSILGQDAGETHGVDTIGYAWVLEWKLLGSG